jgi:nicotinamide mononucleotide transporter
MIEQVQTFFTLSFFLELAGFLFNLLYLYFVIRQKSVAWLWSIFACVIFVWVCYASQLYLQTGLYLFYILISIYGLLKWKNNPVLAIQSMTLRHHSLFILAALIAGLVFGFVFSESTDQHLPYLDGFITSFAVGTTLLIVSKHRENWLYWMVINLASVFLYYTQDLYFLTIMSCILMLFAVRGYQVWNRVEAQGR